jgi:hypothetical protein
VTRERAGEERYGMAKLSTILDQIDAGSMLLPEFQRRRLEVVRRDPVSAEHRPSVLDDDSVPLAQRIVLAEQYRLNRG